MAESRTARGSSFESRVSFIDFFDAIAWMIFKGSAPRIARMFNLDVAIKRAGMLIHPSIYAARMMFATLLAIIVALAMTGLLLVFELPMILKIALGLCTMFIPILTFVSFLMYPVSKISARQKAVEHELPFFAAYLTTMAYSGVPPEKVIEAVANLKIFKGIRAEAQRIVRDMKIFGKDPLTAIDDVVLNHPSRLFREFMLGYTTTVRTGGDVIHYLELKTHDLFRKRIEDLRLLSERVGLFVELFIAISVILALSLYVFFVVSSVLPVKGFGGIGMFMFFSLVVQPAIIVFMLYLVDNNLPKDPVWDKTPYTYLLVSVPLGIAAGFGIFIALRGYELLIGSEFRAYHMYSMLVSLSVALIIISFGGIRGYLEKLKLERGLSIQLSNFLRDLTEVRKTGLSIERCIIYLSQRDYGVLNDVLRKMAGALIVGIDIAYAVRRALAGVKNWILLTVFRFLIDAIQYGGASPNVLDALSRFTNELVMIYEELKRRLRTYVTIPYFGAILLAFISLLVLGMIAQSVQSVVQTVGREQYYAGVLSQLAIRPSELVQIALIASVGSIVNAWLMGLMCGKLKDLTVLSGFIHASILTLLTLAASIISFVLYVQPLLTP